MLSPLPGPVVQPLLGGSQSQKLPREASLDGTVMEVVKQKLLYQGPVGTQGRNDVLCREVLGGLQRRELDLGAVKGAGTPGRGSCRREGPGVCWACVHVWEKTKS